MEYLIPIILVLLLVSGVVTFMVLNATKQSKPCLLYTSPSPRDRS